MLKSMAQYSWRTAENLTESFVAVIIIYDSHMINCLIIVPLPIFVRINDGCFTFSEFQCIISIQSGHIGVFFPNFIQMENFNVFITEMTTNIIISNRKENTKNLNIWIGVINRNVINAFQVSKQMNKVKWDVMLDLFANVVFIHKIPFRFLLLLSRLFSSCHSLDNNKSKFLSRWCWIIKT